MRRPVVALLVLAASLPAGCETGCPAALLEGVLVALPDGSLAVQGADDLPPTPVRWPFPYGVAADDAGPKVVQWLIVEVARPGDRVALGGGMAPPDEAAFRVCGQVDVERAARAG